MESAWMPVEHIARARGLDLGAVRFTGLWVAGSLAGLERPVVAVVGSRAASEAGKALARALARELAEAGVCVLSGLALGVDAAAHRGALDAQAPTIGILGGGHRHFFPPRNRDLAHEMLASGGAVLSPFPPDEPARPGQFLARNGVIAALADALVVVEAAPRSGALNTASWAADRGIPVMAVPGDVDRAKAGGCNALIRDGATLVRDAADVLADLGIPRACAPAAGLREDDPDDAPARALVEALRGEPLDLDRLLAATGQAPGAAVATLARLELAGRIERRAGNVFALAR